VDAVVRTNVAAVTGPARCASRNDSPRCIETRSVLTNDVMISTAQAIAQVTRSGAKVT